MNMRRKIQGLGMILLLCILLCIVPSTYSKSAEEVVLRSSSVKQYLDTISRINDTVSYPGGELALQRFLDKNNVFNSSKSELSIEGIVVIRLSIDSCGIISNKTVMRGIGGDIDEEALRLADLLVFNPATNLYGKATMSEYILKVYFDKPTKEYRTMDVAIPLEVDEFKEQYFNNGPASFAGGKRKMRQYFKNNIVYPPDISERDIEGKVKLLICIDYFGYLSIVHVLSSPDVRLNEEAIRLVKSVRWKPEIRNNETLRSFLTIDIKFKKPKQ
jgi:TonB family protein